MIFLFIFFIISKFCRCDHSYVLNNNVFIKKKKKPRKCTIKQIKNEVIMILEVIFHEGMEIFRNRKQSVEKWMFIHMQYYLDSFKKFKFVFIVENIIDIPFFIPIDPLTPTSPPSPSRSSSF